MLQHEEIPKILPKCKICGAKSTGIHYGVMSCEGCKAFFKRESVKPMKYVCYFGNACPVGPVARGRCRACRYRKCLEEGMISQNALIESSKPVLRVMGKERPRNKFLRSQRSSGPDAGSVDNDSVFAANGDLADRYDSRTPLISPLCKSAVGDLLPRVDIFRFIQSDRHADSRQSGERSNSSDYAQLWSPFEEFGPSRLYGLQLPEQFPGFRLKINLDDEKYSTACRADFQDFLSSSAHGLHVDSTIRSVTSAFYRAYMDQIDLWSEFSRRTLISREIPNQPETTLTMIVQALKDEFEGDAVRADEFTRDLPGFIQLGHKHRAQMILERSFDFFLINHAAYMTKDDYYWCIGQHGFHFNKYWMNQIVNKDWIEFIELAAAEFNELRLTLPERYLFLAAIILHAGTLSVEHKLKLSFVHAHYLDALLHSIRRRLSSRDLNKLFPLLRQVMGRIISFASIDSRYYLSLDLSGVPFDRNRDIREYMLEGNSENVFVARWLTSSIEEIVD